MSRRLFRSSRLVGLAVVLGLFASPAQGHVNLLAPNGGEEMEGCPPPTFTITWKILIFHNQLNWDLWYSTNSAVGPWISIIQNLPPGSSAVGSIHTYNWTVPPVAADTVWVRVRMDNSGTDYYDVSNLPFSITPLAADVNGDNAVNVLDLIDLLLCFGQKAAGGCEAEDVNEDGTVNVLDLIDLLLVFGETCP